MCIEKKLHFYFYQFLYGGVCLCEYVLILFFSVFFFLLLCAFAYNHKAKCNKYYSLVFGERTLFKNMQIKLPFLCNLELRDKYIFKCFFNFFFFMIIAKSIQTILSKILFFLLMHIKINEGMILKKIFIYYIFFMGLWSQFTPILFFYFRYLKIRENFENDDSWSFPRILYIHPNFSNQINVF